MREGVNPVNAARNRLDEDGWSQRTINRTAGRRYDDILEELYNGGHFDSEWANRNANRAFRAYRNMMRRKFG